MRLLYSQSGNRGQDFLGDFASKIFPGVKGRMKAIVIYRYAYVPFGVSAFHPFMKADWVLLQGSAAKLA